MFDHNGNYELGHVPRALHLHFNAMWSCTSENKSKTDGPLPLDCQHRPRAGIAKFALWTLGYTTIVYLEGHMADWKRRGLLFAKPSNEPHE